MRWGSWGVNEEQVCGLRRGRNGLMSTSWLWSRNSGVLLLPGSPRRRGKVSKTMDGNVGNTRQDGGQVATDRNLNAATGLHDGQNRRHLRPGLLAAYMDPVLPAQRHRTHRVLRQVVTQLQHCVFQEARELPPLQECVVRRLSQRTRRQGSVPGCLYLPADDLHQWLCPLQTQHVACGVIELLLAHRVTAHPPEFHPPECNFRQVTPGASPRPWGSVTRPHASPNHPASPVRFRRPPPVRGSHSGGTAAGDRYTWPPPCRSPHGRSPSSFR